MGRDGRDWTEPLMEAVEALLNDLRSRAIRLDPSYTDDYLRAAILYERYADDAGRTLQDARSQPQEETA